MWNTTIPSFATPINTSKVDCKIMQDSYKELNNSPYNEDADDVERVQNNAEIRPTPRNKNRLSIQDRMKRDRLKQPILKNSCNCKEDCWNLITEFDCEVIHGDFLEINV